MKIHLRGKIVATEAPPSFKDENGQDVIYFKNYIKSEDGEMFDANSKDNYQEYEGETGVCTFNARKTNVAGGGWKLSLSGFEIADEAE